MKKLKITTLDQLEKLVLNPKISKKDKFTVFSEVLKELPTFCFKVILDETELENPIFDPANLMVSQMLKIIAEIRADPHKTYYSGVMVIASE